MKKKKTQEQVLLNPRQDRRILPNVQDKGQVRTSVDRRGEAMRAQPGLFVSSMIDEGKRYICDFRVTVKCYKMRIRMWRMKLRCVDVSGTGILLICDSPEQLQRLQFADKIKLKFTITPGSMPEGYESTIRTAATLVRTRVDPATGEVECGFSFSETLAESINRSRGRYLFLMSVFMFIGVVLFVVLMRAESIIYFQFNKMFYLYSIIAMIFLVSRYFFGMLYRPVPIDSSFTPGVTIIIPCFNEQEWIEKTIVNCMNQDYPTDKLEVIVVDDCSTDASVGKIKEAVEKIYLDNELYDTRNRLSYYVQENNAGKREALALGAYNAKHELIVFVDSDSFLDPFAIRNLVQPFKDPKVGGVSGRTDVANSYTNWLTKMQATRYYIAFRIFKAAESYFDTVTCLSGPLACYRKDIVMENMEAWRNQKFLGMRATFGDDRALTNLILRKYRTCYQDTAICSTIVPHKQNVFLKQQMRWKRSWLRESVIAARFIWKKEPFAALFFYIGFLVPFAAPAIVLYNILYIPLVHRVFPLAFLTGILMMSALMSFAYLFFKRSTIWLFSALFCLYYEAVLLWQMPVAWVTFWRSTWGTRMTPTDERAARRRAERRVRNTANK